MDNIRYALRSFGIFNALNAASIQFNSILVRIIVGSLANVPPETIALFTTIEFALNLLFEVPFGRLSDKYGRVRLINLGQAMFFLGILCNYIALLLINDPDLAEKLYIALGIFIGLGKPLMSGSVEAFYQDTISSLSKSEEDKKIAKDSLTLSKKHGKYYNLIAVFLTIALIPIFHSTIGAEHLFVLAMIFRLGTIVLLHKDYLKFGDDSEKKDSKEHDVSKMMALIKKSTLDKEIFSLSALRLITWAMITIVAGYLILTVGRVYKLNPTYYWTIIFSFYLGFVGLGQVFSGKFLPVLVKRFSGVKYLIVSLLLVTLISLLALIVFQFKMSFLIQAFIILAFTSLFSLARTSLMSKITNLLMEKFDSKDMASVLSIHAMPSYAFTALYSFYLTYFRDGAPSLNEAFMSLILLSSLGMMVSLFIKRERHEE